jgi:hypothetical protein
MHYSNLITQYFFQFAFFVVVMLGCAKEKVEVSADQEILIDPEVLYSFTGKIAGTMFDQGYIYMVGSKPMGYKNAGRPDWKTRPQFINLFISKLDLEGNLLFEKPFSNITTTFYLPIIKMFPYKNESLLIFSGHGSWPTLSRWDQNGNRIWERRLEHLAEGVFLDISCNEADEIYIVVRSGKRANDEYENFPILIKIDSDGNEVWTKKYENILISDIHGMLSTEEWVYLLFNNNPHTIYHFNTNGVNVSSDDFDTLKFCGIRTSINDRNTSSLIIGGFCNNQPLLARFDFFGRLIWKTTDVKYGGRGDKITSISLDQQGNIYTLTQSRYGSFPPTPSEIDRIIFHLRNQAGTILKKQTIVSLQLDQEPVAVYPNGDKPLALVNTNIWRDTLFPEFQLLKIHL